MVLFILNQAEWTKITLVLPYVAVKLLALGIQAGILGNSMTEMKAFIEHIIVKYKIYGILCV